MNTSTYSRKAGASRLWWAALGLMIMLLTGCKEIVTLQTGLTDPEANEIIAVLQTSAITASKNPTKEGVTVSVADADLPRATEILEAHGLPHRREARMGDIFKKDGLISTPMEERARYVAALSQELEYTLNQIDGVIMARVHLVLPEKVAAGEPVMPSSAAIFIKHGQSLDPDVIAPRIRQLVARSVPGLGTAGSVDKVSVVFVEGRPEPARPVEPDAAGHGVQMRLLALAVLLLGLGGFAATFAGNPKLNAWLGRFKVKPQASAPQPSAS